MKPADWAAIKAGLELMELPFAVLQDILSERDPELGSRLLADWKEKAKRVYRSAARAHHPDLGGDPEKAKAINLAWSLLERLELNDRPDRIQPPPARRPPWPPNVRVRWDRERSTGERPATTIRFHGFKVSTGSDTAATEPTYDPLRDVMMGHLAQVFQGWKPK